MALRSNRHLSKPVIGVTGNHKSISPSWWCIRLAVALVGGHAVRISVEHDFSAEKLHGLIVSGGDDIHPSLYGAEDKGVITYDRARDKLELEYLEFAMKKGLPVLGICRGHQLLNVSCGGRLYDDIRSMRAKNLVTVLPRKITRIHINSKLSKILASTSIRINALHHQAIEILGDGFVVSSIDTDNIIQAIESRADKNFLGIQWHPEYLFYSPTHLRIFRWLVKQAQQPEQL